MGRGAFPSAGEHSCIQPQCFPPRNFLSGAAAPQGFPWCSGCAVVPLVSSAQKGEKQEKGEKHVIRTGHCNTTPGSLLNKMGTFFFLPKFGVSILQAGLALPELHMSFCVEFVLSSSPRQNPGKHIQPSKYFIYILLAVSKCFQPSACHKSVHHLLLSAPYQSRPCPKKKGFSMDFPWVFGENR